MPLEPRALAFVANSSGDTLERMRQRRGVALPHDLHRTNPALERRIHAMHAVHYAPDAAHPLYDRSARPVCPALFLNTSMAQHTEPAPNCGGTTTMERLAQQAAGGGNARSRAGSRAASSCASSIAGSPDGVAALVRSGAGGSSRSSSVASMAVSAVGGGRPGSASSSRAGDLAGDSTVTLSTFCPGAWHTGRPKYQAGILDCLIQGGI